MLFGLAKTNVKKLYEQKIETTYKTEPSSTNFSIFLFSLHTRPLNNFKNIQIEYKADL